jgi:hypothetical protein
VDDDGKTIGKRRHGEDSPYNLKWVPNFRCDRKIFGANDPDIEDRFGGCVNTRANRVFVMSKSRDTDFPQVIDHIEEALNPNNAGTFPPRRPGHNWSTPGFPPSRYTGPVPQNKAIPGNWAAPEFDSTGKPNPAAKPLTRGTPGVTNTQNRKHFSQIEMHMDVGALEEMHWLIPGNTQAEKDEHQHRVYINYCKYYMPEKYRAPTRPDKLPIGMGNQCDEYPFASTKQDASFAQGNYSLKALNGVQNRKQGDALKKFYGDFRVGEDNKFWMLIEP